jgi:hypothetical protein
MAKSLKQKNQPHLVMFVVANVFGLGAIAFGVPHLLTMVEQLTKGNWEILGRLIAVPALITVITGIVGWATPGGGKEALIFWKFGKNCLPSSRAFTVLGPRDARVDMQRLVQNHGTLPTFAAEQTSLWYGLYRSHANEVSVEDAHGAYLRYREMTTLAFALILAFVCGFLCFHFQTKSLAVGISVLIVEYLLLVAAARNAAVHFVVNVLAIESAEL